jgi:hypothetical protein
MAAFEAERSHEYIVQRVNASLRPIIDVLIRKAKKGDIRSAQILLDRAYGRVLQTPDVLSDRLPAETKIVIYTPRPEPKSIDVLYVEPNTI